MRSPAAMVLMFEAGLLSPHSVWPAVVCFVVGLGLEVLSWRDAPPRP